MSARSFNFDLFFSPHEEQASWSDLVLQALFYISAAGVAFEYLLIALAFLGVIP